MPPDAAPHPALDPAVIAELRRTRDACGNPAFIAQLVRLFQSNAPGRLARIRQAVAERDGAALGHTSHTLKSTCSMLGAARLAEICARLEACGDGGEFEDAAPMLGEATAELGRALEALAALARTEEAEAGSREVEVRGQASE